MKEEEKENNGDTGGEFCLLLRQCGTSPSAHAHTLGSHVHAQASAKRMSMNCTAGHLKRQMQNTLEKMTTKAPNKVPVKLLLRK